MSKYGKTIRLKWDTWEQVAKLGKFTDTPDDIISKLVKAYKVGGR